MVMDALVNISRHLFLIATTLLMPALIVGFIRKIKARLQNRIGAPIIQPLLDLIKLFRKTETVSETASWIFRGSAAVNLAIAFVLSIFVPWILPKPSIEPCDLFLLLYLLAGIRFLAILGSLDCASPFGAFAASREATLSFLVEPAAMLSLVALAVKAHSSDLNVIFSIQNLHPALWLLSGTAFLLSSLVELSRMPIDDPTTHLELTMVHEAMIIEASGRNLAVIELTQALKLTLLFGISAQCYLHVCPLLHQWTQVQVAGASIVSIFLVAGAVGVFESVAVKLNWRKAPEFIAYALTFSFLASMVALGTSTI
ncbi:MAG TPA: NADH-quinone oxidoreductase subunit H [Planktothrix sp.]|jgi:formate hydrogenlyase subunit 4